MTKKFKTSRYTAAWVLLSLSAAYLSAPASYATVFALDDKGNYVIAKGIGATETLGTDTSALSETIGTATEISLPKNELSKDESVTEGNAEIAIDAIPALSDYEVILYDAAMFAKKATDNSSLNTIATTQTENTFALENLNIEIFDRPVELSVITAPKKSANYSVKAMPEFDLTPSVLGIEDTSGNTVYNDIVAAEVSKYDNLDIAFVKSVIEAESNYDPLALSHKGAMGLMQLMPETVKTYDVINPFSPEQNIQAGTAELSRLMDIYNNPAIALAAYNAGQGAVEKYDGVPPFKETQEYIVRILTQTFEKRQQISKAEINSVIAEPESEPEDPDRIFTPMTVQTFDW